MLTLCRCPRQSRGLCVLPPSHSTAGLLEKQPQEHLRQQPWDRLLWQWKWFVPNRTNCVYSWAVCTLLVWFLYCGFEEASLRQWTVGATPNVIMWRSDTVRIDGPSQDGPCAATNKTISSVKWGQWWVLFWNLALTGLGCHKLLASAFPEDETKGMCECACPEWWWFLIVVKIRVHVGKHPAQRMCDCAPMVVAAVVTKHRVLGNRLGRRGCADMGITARAPAQDQNALSFFFFLFSFFFFFTQLSIPHPPLSSFL